MTHLTAKQKKQQTVYGRKRSTVVAAIKDVDASSRTVTGFFNSLYYFDSDWDVSLPGSYNKSIADRGPESSAEAKIKMLRNHNWDKVISRPKVLEQKTIDGITGLYFEAALGKSTAANDALLDYQDEVIDNHSMGFWYEQLEWLSEGTDDYKKVFDLLLNPEDAEGKDGLYAVKQYGIWEGSAVPFGANALTPYLGMKAGDKAGYIESLAKKVEVLRKAVTSGAQSDGHLSNLDMKMKQIEQLILDMNIFEPLKKDTLPGPPRTQEQKSKTCRYHLM